MIASLATLEGDYTPNYQKRYNRQKTVGLGSFSNRVVVGEHYTPRYKPHSRQVPDEMGGILGDIVRVVTAPIRGVTHTALEIGRGVITLDPMRIVEAPFKGVSHIVMETGRGTGDLVTDTFRPEGTANQIKAAEAAKVANASNKEVLAQNAGIVAEKKKQTNTLLIAGGLGITAIAAVLMFKG